MSRFMTVIRAVTPTAGGPATTSRLDDAPRLRVRWAGAGSVLQGRTPPGNDDARELVVPASRRPGVPASRKNVPMVPYEHIRVTPIGHVLSPLKETGDAPRQPDEGAPGATIVLDPVVQPAAVDIVPNQGSCEWRLTRG
jgi:hypothetical protein